MASINRATILGNIGKDPEIRALNNVYPDAILIGGPAFIKVAYNMSILDTIVVTTTKSNITGDPKYKNPLVKNLRHPITQIDFGDIIVRIYKAQHGAQK